MFTRRLSTGISVLQSRTSVKNYNSCRQLTNNAVTKKRNEIFGQEKARQKALISRVEKIQVNYKGVPEECTMLMNKGQSTPFNCAMHVQELLMTRSVLALVNGQPWDIHAPLTEDCELQFLHFKDKDPSLSNEAFWRTGSFLLGYMLERAFKDDHYVELCSFPRPDISSGSFVYDVDLKLPDWKPNSAELNCMSRIVSKLQYEENIFERLEVDAKVAMKMFEDNRYKLAQIPQIADQSSSGSKVIVYRVKDHIDITKGPLVSSTQLIGRYSVAAVHNFESPDYGKLSRVQGVAIPKQLPVHFWTYDLLCERASHFNKTAKIPTSFAKTKQQIAGS